MEKPIADVGAGNETVSQAEATGAGDAATMEQLAADMQNEISGVKQPEAETPKQEESDEPEAGGILPDGAKPPKTEEKPPEEKGEAEAGKEKAEADKPLELKTPDGFTASAKRMGNFQAVAKDLKLSNEGAQKLFDLYHQELAESTQQMAEYVKEGRQRYDDEGRAAIHADPEVGGDNFSKSANLAEMAMRRIFPEKKEFQELKQFYEMANLKNSPLLFKAFVRMGKHLSEASPVVPSGVSGKREPVAGDEYADALKQLYEK